MIHMWAASPRARHTLDGNQFPGWQDNQDLDQVVQKVPFALFLCPITTPTSVCSRYSLSTALARIMRIISSDESNIRLACGSLSKRGSAVWK